MAKISRKRKTCSLLHAYLVTSKDSEIGTDQSSDKFWSRVWVKFTENGNEKERDLLALRNRFHIQISPSCSRFSGSMSKVLRHPQSGENEENQVFI